MGRFFAFGRVTGCCGFTFYESGSICWTPVWKTRYFGMKAPHIWVEGEVAKKRTKLRAWGPC